MEAKGIKNIEELIEGLKVLAITGKNIMKDGKVGLEDLPHLMALLPQQSVLVKAFSDLGEVVDEAKDISGDEAIAIVQKLVAAAKEYKAA